MTLSPLFLVMTIATTTVSKACFPDEYIPGRAHHYKPHSRNGRSFPKTSNGALVASSHGVHHRRHNHEVVLEEIFVK